MRTAAKTTEITTSAEVTYSASLMPPSSAISGVSCSGDITSSNAVAFSCGPPTDRREGGEPSAVMPCYTGLRASVL